MGDYFGHWLKIGRARGAAAAEDLLRQLVPQGRGRRAGCGPASARTAACSSGSSSARPAAADGVETPIGILPTADALDTDGLDISDADLAELLKVDAEEWKGELPSIREHLEKFGDRLPAEIRQQVDALQARLNAA